MEKEKIQECIALLQEAISKLSSYDEEGEEPTEEVSEEAPSGKNAMIGLMIKKKLGK